MNKFLKETLSAHISSNRLCYIIATSAVLVGIIIGIFSGKSAIHESEFNYLDGFLSSSATEGMTPLNVFTKSVLINLRPVVIIWLSSLFVWLIPISFVELGAKGFGIGYSFSYLIFGWGFKGLAISFISLFLQNLIIVPSLIIYTVLQVRFSGDYDKIRKTPNLYKERKSLFMKSFLSLLFILLPVIFCGLIDGYIAPVLVNFLI